MLNGEVTNTNVIVFRLNRSGFESTIYHTGGEHAYQYTTDAATLDDKCVNHIPVYGSLIIHSYIEVDLMIQNYWMWSMDH